MKKRLLLTALVVGCAVLLAACATRASEVSGYTTRDNLLALAEAGDAEAQYFLGSCCRFGQLSFYGKMDEGSKDYDEAEKWYLRAAEQGYENAYFALGLMYENDKCGKEDRDKAIYWFNKYKENADYRYEKGTEVLEHLSALGVTDGQAAEREFRTQSAATVMAGLLQAGAQVYMQVKAAQQQREAGGGSYSGSSYDSGSSYSQPTRHECPLCHGKRTVVRGSNAATFGLEDGSKEWCSECGRYYLRSTGHSHVTCPQCGGKGYFTTD